VALYSSLIVDFVLAKTAASTHAHTITKIQKKTQKIEEHSKAAKTIQKLLF